MHIDHIALDRLSVSKANMRGTKKPPDISDILPSILKRGVIIPVFVRPKLRLVSDEGSAASHFEIVAGKRRYFASLEAERQGKADITLPCITLAEGDDAEALEISMIENMLRQAPDQVTQWESYTRLVKEGRSVDDIAATFALTELQVTRILALGNLLPPIREAFRAGEIDVATIRHLTLATKAQQKAWLALFDDKDGYAPRGQQLKAWLFGGASISTNVALFDIADFDGLVIKDLFEDIGYFADADQFWAAQSAEIEARKAAYMQDGWSGVEIIPPNSRFDSWDYDKTPKRKGGRVYIDVAANGAVSFHEGYLTLKEVRRRLKSDSSTASGSDSSTSPTKARAEITSTITSYVDLHRHAAVRSALASQPHVALRVMVAHAICGSPLWRVEVQSQRNRNETTTESVETCLAEVSFDERRRAVLAVLGIDADEPCVTLQHEPSNGITGLFARLLELPDSVVMEIMAVVMAETLASGTSLIETLGVHLDINMADYWTADSAFFDLIRDREILTAILTEVGGASVAQANAAEKTKTIKSVINDCLTGAGGRTKADQWTPRWLAFPPSAYTPRGGVATVEAANRASWLAESEARLEADKTASGAIAEGAASDTNTETVDALETQEEQRLAA
jgi:ParB family transcriptional regulator, chromosome partitioning protein